MGLLGAESDDARPLFTPPVPVLVHPASMLRASEIIIPAANTCFIVGPCCVLGVDFRICWLCIIQSSSAITWPPFLRAYSCVGRDKNREDASAGSAETGYRSPKLS